MEASLSSLCAIPWKPFQISISSQMHQLFLKYSYGVDFMTIILSDLITVWITYFDEKRFQEEFEKRGLTFERFTPLFTDVFANKLSEISVTGSACAATASTVTGELTLEVDLTFKLASIAPFTRHWSVPFSPIESQGITLASILPQPLSRCSSASSNFLISPMVPVFAKFSKNRIAEEKSAEKAPESFEEDEDDLFSVLLRRKKSPSKPAQDLAPEDGDWRSVAVDSAVFLKFQFALPLMGVLRGQAAKMNGWKPETGAEPVSDLDKASLHTSAVVREVAEGAPHTGGLSGHLYAHYFDCLCKRAEDKEEQQMEQQSKKRLASEIVVVEESQDDEEAEGVGLAGPSAAAAAVRPPRAAEGLPPLAAKPKASIRDVLERSLEDFPEASRHRGPSPVHPASGASSPVLSASQPLREPSPAVKRAKVEKKEKEKKKSVFGR